jgi:hypothetical protein
MVVIEQHCMVYGLFWVFYILQGSAESIISIYTVASESLVSEGTLTSCKRNELKELNTTPHETEFSS